MDVAASVPLSPILVLLVLLVRMTNCRPCLKPLGPYTNRGAGTRFTYTRLR
jgi:hypothetical protein